MSFLIDMTYEPCIYKINNQSKGMNKVLSLYTGLIIEKVEMLND